VTPPAHLRSFIGGGWKESESDAWIADINPSNANDVIGQVPRGTIDGVIGIDGVPCVESAHGSGTG